MKSYKLYRLFIGLVTVAALATTMNYICVFRTGVANSKPGNRATQSVMFNGTLLAMAAIDLSNANTDSDEDELISLSSHNRRFSQWCTLSGFKLANQEEFKNFMVYFRQDLVNWSNRRKHSDNVSASPPLFLNSVRYPIDHHSYKSCAVVGNSGVLLQSEHGDLIDSHEIVIRLNNAKVNSFGKHVGTKTNISFINSNIWEQCVRNGSCNCNPYGTPVTTLIAYICQPIHFLDITLCNISSTAPHPALLVTDPSFDAQCARIVKYYSLKRMMVNKSKSYEDWMKTYGGPLFHYSSGMQAIMLALRVCARVSLFGFGKGNYSKHHYHNNQTKELRLHDYQAEYDVYQDLIHSPGCVPFLAKDLIVPPVVWYQYKN